MGWLYVFLTIALTAFGQIVLKWHLAKVGQMPTELGPMVVFLVRQLFEVPVILSFGSAFIAALAWMAALTKFQLNLIYPFMSLCFPLTMILSAYFLGEDFGWSKLIGISVILIGLFILTR